MINSDIWASNIASFRIFQLHSVNQCVYDKCTPQGTWLHNCISNLFHTDAIIDKKLGAIEVVREACLGRSLKVFAICFWNRAATLLEMQQLWRYAKHYAGSWPTGEGWTAKTHPTLITYLHCSLPLTAAALHVSCTLECLLLQNCEAFSYHLFILSNSSAEI